MTRIHSPSFTALPFDKLRPLDSAHVFKDHKITHDGKVLDVRTDPTTNWWRVPERWETSGPVLGQWRDVPSNGFQIETEIEMHSQYKMNLPPGKSQASGFVKGARDVLTQDSDQATLFVYFGPECWCKAGLEYDKDILWNGPVVVNPWSDWSPSRATSNKVHVLLSYDVPTRTLEIYLDGDLIRAAHAFGPKAPELTSSDRQEQLEGKTNQVFVGVMACSPRGGGTEVKFSNFGWMDGALTPE